MRPKKEIKNVLNFGDLDVSLGIFEIKKKISPHHKKFKKKPNSYGRRQKERQQHRQKTDMLVGRTGGMII